MWGELRKCDLEGAGRKSGRRGTEIWRARAGLTFGEWPPPCGTETGTESGTESGTEIGTEFVVGPKRGTGDQHQQNGATPKVSPKRA